MRRLGAGQRHVGWSSERGAVTVVVSVLVFFGVVMGSLAVTVDIGQIMSERRQLQNGADAASLALAELCAQQSNSCSDANAPAVLTQLAGANAVDGKSTISAVCGKNVTKIATTCVSPTASDAADLGKCNPPSSLFAGATPYVEVTTETKTATGNTLFTPFARALAGSGSTGTTGHACARAAIVAATGTGPTLPIIASPCEWAAGTNGGKNLAPSPPYTVAPSKPVSKGGAPLSVPSEIGSPARTPPTHFPVMIGAHADVPNCNTGNGQTYPGGFSWVSAPTKCAATFDATGTILVGSNGASVPGGCQGNLAQYLGTEVFLPIGVALDASGTYTIDGVASFYLAGYDNLPAGSPKTDSVYQEPNYVCVGKCNGSQQYLWGWFTSGVKPVWSLSGTSGTSWGATSVIPAG